MSTSPEQPISEPSVMVSMSSDPIEGLLRSRMLQAPPRPGVMASLEGYEVLGLLGEGGMGLVLLAREAQHGKHVAIKLLKPRFIQTPQAVHRFLIEARHMQRLAHPNILTVQEVSDRGDGPFFVVPYMEKGSLARTLSPGKPMETQRVLHIARDVAEALAYAHGRGITHRDLKPGNVLLDGADRAFVADFGLGRTVYNDSIADVRDVRPEGTPAYMAPEIASGQAGDTRCDIYSFGAMLYEMLAGRPPYDGDTSQQIMAQVRAGPPTPLTTLNPGVPPGLLAIVEGAMARELRERYASMADVAADLKRLDGGERPLGPRGLPWLGMEGRLGQLNRALSTPVSGTGHIRKVLRRGLLAFATFALLGTAWALRPLLQLIWPDPLTVPVTHVKLSQPTTAGSMVEPPTTKRVVPK